MVVTAESIAAAGGRTMSHKMRYAVMMTLAGVVTALVVYLLTSSFWWAVLGLFAAGFVINLVAEGRSNGRMRFTDTRDTPAEKRHCC